MPPSAGLGVTDELRDLRALAAAMGVHTSYRDGFGDTVEVGPDTLVRVCAALGADVHSPTDAGKALEAHTAAASRLIPPVLVAWDGRLPDVTVSSPGPPHAELRLEDGGVAEVEVLGSEVRVVHAMPAGYHRLRVDASGREETCTVISAPQLAWRPGSPASVGPAPRSWGLGAHLPALRSERSRSVGDLQDLSTFCGWVASQGGDLVTVLPPLPTFNQTPAEPSPYSPVSRLFWSELMLDLGAAHVPTESPHRLDVTRADAEVRAALAGVDAPDPDEFDAELVRYARFRGAQIRHGRNWRDWPKAARTGVLVPADVDAEEERFHLVAQTRARAQLGALARRLRADGVRLGLDLAVGAHPDGYDTWSRQDLFAEGVSVGAPPDPGFAGGQDWGFAPVLPEASRAEGHRYLADAIAHQAALAGVLRVDHVMAMSRLYWIPHGADRNEGTYVSYPTEELFAVLTLESHRNECRIIGENLGTVPPTISEALPRHGIPGMYLAQFAAHSVEPAAPTEADVALVGTHDTPTFAGWLLGADIDERVQMDLLNERGAARERASRAAAIERLAAALDSPADDPRALLAALLAWLGRSESPLVVPWVEDLWLEPEQVNLPGTSSSQRPNWQRPMDRLLEEIAEDPQVLESLRLLNDERGTE